MGWRRVPLLCSHLTQAGECLPLPAQLQPSRSVCEHRAGGHTGLAVGQLWPVGHSSSTLMGKPVIQRALPGGQQAEWERDSLSRRKCLTASSPPGWSGAPISLANQPGRGLIRGLCLLISCLVHLLLHSMSPLPPRGAAEALVFFCLYNCLLS